MKQALDRAGYSRKKLELVAMEQSRYLRQMWMAVVRENFTSAQIVFVDESHCDPNDCRRKYGLSLIGQPAFLKTRGINHGTGNSCSAVAAMSLTGIFAVAIFENVNLDGDMFIQSLANNILPFMNPYPGPGSVLILDNAPTHNAYRIFELCQQHQIRLVFLPPYSYDFSAIELCFHQGKHFIRVNHPDLNVDGVFHGNFLAEGLNSIGMDDAVHYYRHCGYEVTNEDIFIVLDEHNIVQNVD
jgi:hypothetical protein